MQLHDLVGFSVVSFECLSIKTNVAIISLTFFYRYVITELLQSDLHKIIVSHQPLSSDHIKVFLYQILRGKLSARNP